MFGPSLAIVFVLKNFLYFISGGLMAHQVELPSHRARVAALILSSGLCEVFYVLSASALVSSGFFGFLLPAKHMLIGGLVAVCACAWCSVMDWLLIQGVFLPHA